MSIIALDIGTSGMRSVIYSLSGDMGWSVYIEYHTDFPQPGLVEQDPKTWTDAAEQCLASIVEHCRVDDPPQAIAVTSQRSSLIPIKDGRAMRTAIMWQDKRTLPQCASLIGQYGLENLYRKTGLRTNPYFVLPKILWLAENQPEIYSQADRFIGVQDLVIYHLTGQYKTDYSQACRTLLMNIESFNWDADLLQIAGIGEEKLPELLPPGAVAGGLTRDMAERFGLEEGLPVILAGGDQQNAAVALGAIVPGLAEANTGTGSFVISATDKPVFDAECRIICQASAIAGKWIMEAGIFNTGATYRWFKERMCKDIADDANPYDLMNAEAATSEIGSGGVVMIPHFEGSAAPYWNPLAKGVFFNLALKNTRSDMIRAIMEGISVELYDNLCLMEELTETLRVVSVAGGMAHSDLFCEIQSNIYDKSVIRYENSEATSLGAAMIAAVSLGVYEDVVDAHKHMVVSMPRVFRPDEEKVKRSRAIIERKHSLYTALEKGGVYRDFSFEEG